MQNNLVKRSYFQTVTVNNTVKSIMVEADEVYLTMVQPSTVGIQVRRQRERDLADFLTANPSISGGASQTWGLMDLTYGRVNLLSPLTSDGKLMNRPVTTAANDLTQPERFHNSSVGVKEIIDFQSATSGQNATVLIELVHHVPASEIGA